MGRWKYAGFVFVVGLPDKEELRDFDNGRTDQIDET